MLTDPHCCQGKAVRGDTGRASKLCVECKRTFVHSGRQPRITARDDKGVVFFIDLSWRVPAVQVAAKKERRSKEKIKQDLQSQAMLVSSEGSASTLWQRPGCSCDFDACQADRSQQDLRSSSWRCPEQSSLRCRGHWCICSTSCRQGYFTSRMQSPPAPYFQHNCRLHTRICWGCAPPMHPQRLCGRPWCSQCRCVPSSVCFDQSLMLATAHLCTG